MKVCLTGWNGYLAGHLFHAETDIEWTQELTGSDAVFLLGSPTFPIPKSDPDEAIKMADYLDSVANILDGYTGRVIFASTTGVTDEILTPYTIIKLQLEKYIQERYPDHLILRIGSIITRDPADINLMKPDRIQPRIVCGDYSNIKFSDEYLDVAVFVEETLCAINSGRTGIMEYPLETLSLLELRKLSTL